jgi:uncharacterized protein YpmB
MTPAAIIALVAAVIAAIVYLTRTSKSSFQAGRTEAEKAQVKADIDAIDTAMRARRDADSLPDDKRDYRD